MSDPGIVYESIYNQMAKLIVQPLIESAISTTIVIDALNECENEGPISKILSVLGRFVDQIPNVKIFITGRPEPRIQTTFRLPPLDHATNVFLLHAVEPGQVNSDIRLFYQYNCSQIRIRRGGPDKWPTEEQLDLLCERAAGLFIYATAAVRFIDQINKNPESQLDRLLQSQGSALEGKVKLRAGTTLDLIYMSVLLEAFGDNDPEDDAKVRSVLGVVVLATSPLPPSSIATLLGFNSRDVFSLLSSVQSLLVFLEDVNHPVRLFHKSFADFIIDAGRCATPRFCVHPPDQHTQLLVHCLKLMNQNLEQNMCKLPDRVANAEVEDLNQRAEKNIGGALEYACRSWHKHLISTTSAHKREITPVLLKFLEKKFLFWLEILSILGVTREAVCALETAEKWSGVCLFHCLFYFQRLIGLDPGVGNSPTHQGLLSFRTHILRRHHHVRTTHLHLCAPPIPSDVERTQIVHAIRPPPSEGCAWVTNLMGPSSCCRVSRRLPRCSHMVTVQQVHRCRPICNDRNP